MTAPPIDLWNAETFDPELLARLRPHENLMVDYYRRDDEITLSHDLGRGPGRSILRPANVHAAAFYAFRDGLVGDMAQRSIRAWHYTRLTDAEIDALRQHGPHPSTPATLQLRLEGLVAAGMLSTVEAAALYAASPFHTQLESRTEKFWMVSHPDPVEDGGVTPLMSYWGGEVASMHLRDQALKGRLATIGRPRILELAAPLSATRHAFDAAEAVVATFARSRGAIPQPHDFDLYVDIALPPGAILDVYSEGDATFSAMGKTFPPGFVDHAIGRWKELTGDDD